MAKIIAVAGKGGVGKTTVQLPEDSPVRTALVQILQNIGL
jgi:anion-transporting  ArsA/GET3 family ATPase